MEAEQPSGGGLYVPGKDRVVYRRPKKSRLGKLLVFLPRKPNYSFQY